MRIVAVSGVDPGVIRLELPVSVAERLSLVGRLSEVLTIVLTSPAGARFPPHRCSPRYQARSADCPPRPALTQIAVPRAGPGGPSKHATTLPIWSLPGPLGASAAPQSAAAHRPRFFYWGEARGLMPGGGGS